MLPHRAELRIIHDAVYRSKPITIADTIPTAPAIDSSSVAHPGEPAPLPLLFMTRTRTSHFISRHTILCPRSSLSCTLVTNVTLAL
jgi:hypothetical protein